MADKDDNPGSDTSQNSNDDAIFEESTGDIERGVKHENTKGWDINVSTELRSYAAQSAGFNWMFARDAAYYFAVNTNISIATMVLTVLSTIGIVGCLVIVQTGKVMYLYYTLTCINILVNVFSGCLQGYQTIKNFTLRISQTVEKAAKYGALYRSVRLQFILPPAARDYAEQFIKSIYDRWNELERERPFLRNSTKKAWEEYSASLKTDTSLYDRLIPMPPEYRTSARGIGDKDTNPSKIGKIGKFISSMM